METSETELSELINENLVNATKVLELPQQEIAKNLLGVPIKKVRDEEAVENVEPANRHVDARKLVLQQECERLLVLFGICRNISQEIDTVDDQKERLIEILNVVESFFEKAQTLFKKKHLSIDEHGGLKEEIETIQKLERELYDEILVPHQVEYVQSRQLHHFLPESKGLYSTVFSEHYAMALTLGNEQLESLRSLSESDAQKANQIAETMTQNISKTKKEAKANCLTSLSEEQLKILFPLGLKAD